MTEPTTTEPATTFGPVRATVSVRCGPERAFEAFTAEMGRWWPTTTHAIEPEEATTVVVDGRVGGTIRERLADGTEYDWADITAWDPPRHLAFSWHPSIDWTVATDVDVRFVAEDDGTTRVELTHTGWERLGDRATAARTNYDRDWPFVVGRYVDHVGGG